MGASLSPEAAPPTARIPQILPVFPGRDFRLRPQAPRGYRSIGCGAAARCGRGRQPRTSPVARPAAGLGPPRRGEDSMDKGMRTYGAEIVGAFALFFILQGADGA